MRLYWCFVTNEEYLPATNLHLPLPSYLFLVGGYHGVRMVSGWQKSTLVPHKLACVLSFHHIQHFLFFLSLSLHPLPLFPPFPFSVCPFAVLFVLSRPSFDPIAFIHPFPSHPTPFHPSLDSIHHHPLPTLPFALHPFTLHSPLSTWKTTYGFFLGCVTGHIPLDRN